MNGFATRMSPGRIVLVLFALALLLRVAVVLLVFDDTLNFSDERHYFADGMRMAAEGDWVGPRTTEYPPAILYFIAAVGALGGDLTAVRLTQAVLGALAVVLTFLLGRQVFGTAVGVLAASVAAVYPYLLYLTGVLYNQNHVLPLVLLLVLALYRRQAGGGFGWVVVCGLCLGFGGSFVPPILVAAPPLGIWHAARRGWGPGSRDVGVMAAVAVLALTPVLVRGYVVEHRFVPVAGGGGPALYWSNNPNMDPEERDAERWVELNMRQVGAERDSMGWTQAQSDSALNARARDYIRANPGTFIVNCLRRTKMMWWIYPKPYTKDQINRKKEILAAVTSAPVLLLGFFGALWCLPRWARFLPFYAVPICFTLVYTAIVGTVRYRFSFEPLLMILGAAFLLRLVRPSLLEDRVAPPGSSGE